MFDFLNDKDKKNPGEKPGSYNLKSFLLRKNI